MPRGTVSAAVSLRQRCYEAMPGRRTYELRAGGKRTWRSIAAELGYSTAHHGRAALEMARRYASGAGLPWPPGGSDGMTGHDPCS